MPPLCTTDHRGESRKRVGDWGDTIVGKGLARVVTQVDRKSGLLRMRRVPSGEADTVMRAIVHALHPLTWDNGSEFAEHALVDIALSATSYFAEPYSSLAARNQRKHFNPLLGTNGLIRQYLPKKCDLSTYSDADIQAIEDKLNQRPRKRLGSYATANFRCFLQPWCTS
jgi:IS30 family transposase